MGTTNDLPMGAQSDASGGALSDAGAVLRVSSTFNT